MQMQNHLRYVEKTDPWSSHSLILGWLSQLPPGTRILDVGASSGLIGRRLENKGLSIHGIEPDVKAADLAKQYYDRIIVSTIECIPGEQITGFDIVILADLLEHLVDPQAVLQNLVSFQDENAIFLISVPNIANLWIRLNLLLGRFDYTDKGILDKTHLRFFTRRSFRKLLIDVDLEIEVEKATPIPLNLVHPFFKNSIIGKNIHHLLAVIANWIPSVLGYQFVVKAKINR